MFPQAQSCCNQTRAQNTPGPEDSLQSLCWPTVRKEPMPFANGTNAQPNPPMMRDVDWPVSEPWRRNVGQPRCQGQGRCQGDAQRCNSKYRYGVDDVGRCPTSGSCKASYSCRDQHVHPSQLCPRPCPVPDTCNRLTTRCFEWPIARQENCAAFDPNMDLRGGPRPDLMSTRDMPECCPTCHRSLVDLQAGPLQMNY